MHFVFQHGWGFDSSCWREWLHLLDSSPTLGDRGYWGKPAPVTALPSPPDRIVIAHSLGLHLLPQEVLSEASMLAIIGGFAHFHGETPAAGRFTRRHLERMRARLTTEPDRLIEDFFRDCEFPGPPPRGAGMDIALLTQDLHVLNESRIEAVRCRHWPPVLMLHGTEDRIVSLKRAEELAVLPRRSRLIPIPHAGHGLPFTHPRLCLDLILAFYRDIAHSGS